MLLSQSHTLNAIFTTMVMKMGSAEYLANLEAYGRLALKAQNQARQSISTLAEIKGVKKTTFIHQVNNAHNQQVNNGADEKLNKSSNEKVVNEVDRENASKGVRPNQQNETLALPENQRGVSAISPKRSKARHEISTHKGTAKTVS